MSQSEVHDFLIEQRKKTDKWFTIKEVKNELKLKGFSNGQIQGVTDDLFKLSVFNLIQWKGVGVWRHHKEFRAFKNK